MLTLILTIVILEPYLTLLAVAAAMAVLFYPVYEKIRMKMKRNNLAAVLTIVIALLIVFVPLIFFGSMALHEATILYAEIDNNNYFSQSVNFLESEIEKYFPGSNISLDTYIIQGLTWTAQNVVNVFAGVTQTIFSFVIGIIAFYYFLTDGKTFMGKVMARSPLPKSSNKEITSKLTNSVNSIIKGSLIIALIQGFLTGIGFALFGVPNPALWGSIAAVTSLIPGVGTAIITIPAVIFLVAQERYMASIALLIWGATAVGLIDNFLGPKLVGRGAKIHPFLILISALGGLNFFGPMGFLLGPLIISLLLTLGELYFKSID